LFTVHEFLLKLVKTIGRESISQWDKDCFNVSAKKEFYGFAEFVSLHYALSQRSETPYWKAVSKRKFQANDTHPKTGIVSSFENLMSKRMHQSAYDFELGGMNCIAPGMGFFPMDASTIKRSMFTNNHPTLLDVIDRTFEKWDKEQEKWNAIADAAPTLCEHLDKKYNG
jgi:hypothetical protein